jgi:hypothetical protein
MATDGHEFAGQLLGSPGYYHAVAAYLAVEPAGPDTDSGYGIFVIEGVGCHACSAELHLAPTGAGAEAPGKTYRLFVDAKHRESPTRLYVTERSERGDERECRKLGSGIRDIRSFASSVQLACCPAIELPPQAIYQAVGVRAAQAAESAAHSASR